MLTRFVFAALLIAAPAFAYRTAAWIPSWDTAAVESMRLHGGKLSESNPVWYALDSSGAIVPMWNAEDVNLVAALSGTAIIPTLQNAVNGRFDAALVRTLIASPESRERHAEAITRLVVQKAWDGIDIDYEALSLADRPNFTAFITVLAGKLHGADKQLSVTVHPKTSDSQNWDGPGAHDYAAIGSVADTVKLMVYDYHWSTSEAGPIAPLEWSAAVVGYAVSEIPANKVIAGLPWYGYDWKGKSGRGVVYSEAVELARSHNAAISRDGNGEATFRYADHVVYFQDAASYEAKVDYILQRHPQVGGFTTWRVGGEDPYIWDRVSALHGGETETGDRATAPSTFDFAITGPATASLPAGTSLVVGLGLITSESSTLPIEVSLSGSLPRGITATAVSATGDTGGEVSVVISAEPKSSGSGTVTVRFVVAGVLREHLLEVEVRKARRQRPASL